MMSGVTVNYFFFFRMDDPANAEDVKENFKKNFDKTKMAGSDLDWERDKIDRAYHSAYPITFPDQRFL